MASNSLVLEQRMDRNGKLVRRWVKPSSSDAKKSSIPAPVAKSKAMLRDELATEINKDSGYSFENVLPDIQNAIGAIEDSTFSLLSQRFEEDDARKPVFAKWLIYYSEVDEPYLRELLYYMGSFRKHTKPEFVEHAVVKLKNYQIPHGTDHTDVTDETAKSIHALLSIADILHSDDFNYLDSDPVVSISNNELVELILNNPDKLEQIKDAVSSRKTEDVAVIKEMLNTYSAVSDGAL